ncbi:MAG: hypothetical protein Q9228_002537 [Teloschistes exilis]
MEGDKRAELLARPALPPPSGVTSNFVNPWSNRVVFIPASAVCVFFSSVFVMIRIGTRIAFKKPIGWDDYLCIVAAEAQLLLIAYCAVGAASIPNGSGVHQWNVPLGHYIEFIKFVNAEELLYCIAIIPTKTSILLQQISIFIPIKNSLYYAAHALIWLNAIQYTIIFFLFTFLCTPRRRIWEGDLTPGTCLDHKAIIISGSGINILSDFAILALPLGRIWKMNLPADKKRRVSAVFAMGLFACVSSIMRFIAGIALLGTNDLTYTLVELYLWTVAELSSGIICGCFPTVPLFIRCLKNFKCFSRRASEHQNEGPRPLPDGQKRRTLNIRNLAVKVPSKRSQTYVQDSSLSGTSAQSGETYVGVSDVENQGKETPREHYERNGSFSPRTAST